MPLPNGMSGCSSQEITGWQTTDEIQDLLAEIKGRRRFQGWGAYYERGEKVDAETVIAKEPKKLGRVSGGSGKGRRETGAATVQPLRATDALHGQSTLGGGGVTHGYRLHPYLLGITVRGQEG